MLRTRTHVILAILISLVWMVRIPAQSNSDSTPASAPPSSMAIVSPQADPAGNSANTAMPSTNAPGAPAAAASTDPTTTHDASDSMSDSDFVIDGVPYAKVLYLEDKVWIRPPGDTTFHQLTEDEPIAAQSVIYTGMTGTLDFATGPGMAVRMVPQTLVIVDQLPQPPPATATQPASAPSTANASQVAVRKGTIFSALGREDGEPIDFKVRTPLGVAGAKGTMFATTASEGQSEVDMLHGTVNFETPDHQTSQITAGQSQQISGSSGKYQLGQRQAFNPARSDAFFNHAGGLLEHASGYGVVRRGLGPDVARTFHERGYKLPSGMEQRFQNAGKMHYKNRPAFNRGRQPKSTLHQESHPSGAGPAYHPAPATGFNPHPTPQEEHQGDRKRPDRELDRKNKKLGR